MKESQPLTDLQGAFFVEDATFHVRAVNYHRKPHLARHNSFFAPRVVLS